MPKDLAIDLGSVNTSVYKKDVGIVLREPSVVAYHSQNGEVLYTGNEALRMIGRAPESVKVIRPLKNGAISDFDITQKLIRILFKKTNIGRFSRPRVLICVPSVITPVEQRALVGATYRAGASEVHLISQPVAAALGCGLEIHKHIGNMVVDLGAGTTETIITSLQEVVAQSAIKMGSFGIDVAIQKYVKDAHGIAIGQTTAEKIKMILGSAIKGRIHTKGEVQGLDIATSKPRLLVLQPAEIHDAIELRVREIIESVIACIRKAPPELNHDILNRGIHLTGGGSLLNGIDQRISEAVNVPVHIMSAPMDCAIYGAGKCLKSLAGNQKLFLN